MENLANKAKDWASEVTTRAPQIKEDATKAVLEGGRKIVVVAPEGLSPTNSFFMGCIGLCLALTLVAVIAKTGQYYGLWDRLKQKSLAFWTYIRQTFNSSSAKPDVLAAIEAAEMPKPLETEIVEMAAISGHVLEAVEADPRPQAIEAEILGRISGPPPRQAILYEGQK